MVRARTRPYDFDGVMKTLRDVLLEEAGIRSFARLLRRTDLWKLLDGQGPHTVLAPDEGALSRLPENLLDSMIKEKWRLREVLAYHIIPDRVASRDLSDMEAAKTLNGRMLMISGTAEGIRLDGSRLLRTDLECRNGYLHILDRMLWPK